MQAGMASDIAPGTIALSCSATTTGAITWYIEYEPLWGVIRPR